MFVRPGNVNASRMYTNGISDTQPGNRKWLLGEEIKVVFVFSGEEIKVGYVSFGERCKVDYVC